MKKVEKILNSNPENFIESGQLNYVDFLNEKVINNGYIVKVNKHDNCTALENEKNTFVCHDDVFMELCAAILYEYNNFGDYKYYYINVANMLNVTKKLFTVISPILSQLTSLSSSLMSKVFYNYCECPKEGEKCYNDKGIVIINHFHIEHCVNRTNEYLAKFGVKYDELELRLTSWFNDYLMKPIEIRSLFDSVEFYRSLESAKDFDEFFLTFTRALIQGGKAILINKIVNDIISEINEEHYEYNVFSNKEEIKDDLLIKVGKLAGIFYEL